MSAVDTLPAPIAVEADAPLPQKYEAARTAIAECERIDECKTWADKAAAMASYARQANDDSLRVMAVRIQDRALRRAGELLKQIPRADESTRYGRVAAVPPVTRTQAATDAGLSERQRKTALRVAAVPEATFEAQVESSRPPTVTQLAKLGKGSRPATRNEPASVIETAENADFSTRSPWQDIECAETRAACETLERFARYCDTCAVSIGRELTTTEADLVRRHIATVARWLDGIEADLAQGA